MRQFVGETTLGRWLRGVGGRLDIMSQRCVVIGEAVRDLWVVCSLRRVLWWRSLNSSDAPKPHLEKWCGAVRSMHDDAVEYLNHVSRQLAYQRAVAANAAATFPRAGVGRGWPALGISVSPSLRRHFAGPGGGGPPWADGLSLPG